MEKALLDFLTQNDIDVYNEIIKRNAERAKVLMIPFDPFYKNAVYIRNDPEDVEKVDIYMIGAPDQIIRDCQYVQDPSNIDNVLELDFDSKERIIEQVVNGQMAKDGLKTIAFAHKRMELDELNQLMIEFDVESSEFRSEIQSLMVYMACFGMHDELRPSIDTSIQLIKYGRVLDANENPAEAKQQVKVRLISGDM
jgi:magnesium-transporting ATPase (P-type)